MDETARMGLGNMSFGKRLRGCVDGTKIGENGGE